MTSIALLGMAPLPFEHSRRHHAPGIRAWQLARPLLRAGHRVSLLLCRYPEAYDIAIPAREDLACPEGDGRIVLLAPSAFDGELVDDVLREDPPHMIVGATIRPAVRAARASGCLPFWADLLGHTLGEGHAKALLHRDDGLLLDYFRQEVEVLLRGDAFSGCCHAQRLAMLGELGLLGRLNSHTGGYPFVHVLPCAAIEAAVDVQGPRLLRGAAIPEDAFIVLWSGGFNTWVDDRTLFAGLEQAMARSPRLRFVSTGGCLEGQDHETYPRFERAVQGSPYRDRFHLLGWVEPADLERCYAEADVGICVDRDIPESWLGGRNRIQTFLARGLPLVVSRAAEVSHDVERDGVAFGFPPGDADALCRILLSLAGRESHACPSRAAIAEYARRTMSPEATTVSLQEFARAPFRAPDAGTHNELGAKLATLADAVDAKDRSNAEMARRLGTAAVHVRNLETLVREKDLAIAELRRFESRVKGTVAYRLYDRLRAARR